MPVAREPVAVAEQAIEGLEQIRLGTPVDGERIIAGAVVPFHLGGGVQIGGQIGTAEAVNRLLGIADDEELRPCSPSKKMLRKIRHWSGSVS